MRQVKTNRPYSTINNTVIGVTLAQLMLQTTLSAQAGPQSILDPYASIQPAGEKTETRSFLKKKEPKKQVAKAPVSDSIISTDAEGNHPLLPKKKAVKVKPAKVASNQPLDSINTGNNYNKAASADKPGFFAGVKEIQHGYITTFKAAGQGIVNGSKAAGSKVAEGTKGVFGGVGSSNLKIKAPHILAKKPKVAAPAPIIDNQDQFANSGMLPNNIVVKNLPGKPLDQALAEKKRLQQAKDKPITAEEAKPSMISSTFNKINFFNKKKKIKIAPMTASSPNGIAH